MSLIDHLQNYYNDLRSAQYTPLLIELCHTDLKALSQEHQTVAPLLIAQSVFDRECPNRTSIVVIDGDDVSADDQFFLLDQLLEQLRNDLKEIKNLAVLKESLKSAASIATGGVLEDLFSDQLDNGLSFVLDEIGGEFSSFFNEIVLDNVDASDRLLSEIEDLLHDYAGDTLGDLIASITEQKLLLSTEAKRELNHLSNRFAESENIDLFQLAFKLLIAIAIKSPKLFYINNPHRLDDNSIALLSLLFSYAKHQKEQDKHIGLSVVYTYSDPSFHLYQDVDPELTIKQQLLTDQRRFVQRYAMLERPSSDIPNIAVRSSLFIGRQEELHTLNKQFATRIPVTLSVISGEPGIGKTALVIQHIKTITKSSSAIVLTLLNEVGNNTSNTGLSSLEKSIIEQEQRLHHLRSFKEKTLGYLKNLNAKDVVYKAAGLLVANADQALSVIEVGTQRIKTDANLNRLQEMGMSSFENKSEDEKEHLFNKLDTAITLLTQIQSEDLPIIVFIDDLQWIDNIASEYIVTRLLKRSDIYIIATMRPSDAATQYNTWQSNLQHHRHALSLLAATNVAGSTEFSQTPEADQLIDCSALHCKVLTLSGFDKHALSQLIARVISGEREQHHELAECIVSILSNGNSTEVNTLFAVEAINILCDAKLYRENNFEQLILNAPLRFNSKISHLSETLKVTFESLQRKYQDSLVHASQTGAHQGFNLMAYAILEERLHLLKIYFGEMGNAAVNTLLFSSILGTPFSSTIVRHILHALAKTNKAELQSLKSHLLQNQLQISLQAEHYAIIDEVYEILSRLTANSDQYQYSHGLLHIFLDKQFDYLLDDIFKETNKVSKDALIYLIYEVTHKQFEALSFASFPKQALTAKQAEDIIFHRTVLRNVLAKGYSYHPALWAKRYVINLKELAILYSGNNQLEKAIDLEEQSLEICTPYYQKNPGQWAECYTITLNNLAVSYSRNNQLEKNIDLLEQSLEICTLYYQQNPGQWVESYTNALNNLAASYRTENQLEKAISLGEQSLEVITSYYQQDPDHWEKSYTDTLNSLAVTYRTENQLEKAISLGEQSLAILSRCYQKKPEQWAREYTTSLTSLGRSYCNNNQLEKAIAMQEQSFEICKFYYQQNPHQWAEKYTACLSYLAHSYQNNNQLEKAIPLKEQFLEICARYYQQNPDQWPKEYMIGLSNLARSYVQNNQLEKAILLKEQFLEISARYYQKNPDQWAESYTTSLSSLALSYQKNKQVEKSIALQEQYLEVLTHHYQQAPDQWAVQYTTCLRFLTRLYQEDGQLENVIALREQFLEICGRHYQKNPDQWAKDYIIGLRVLAVSYMRNNQLKQAMPLYEQSIVISLRHYQQNPDQWANDYASSLNDLALYFKKNNQLEQAIPLEEQSLEIYGRYYQQNPDQWVKEYTTSLKNLARSYQKNSQLEQAIPLEEQLLEISARYYKQKPYPWKSEYTTSLKNLAKSYQKNNQLKQTIAIQEQSLEVCGRYYQKTPSQWARFYAPSLRNLVSSYRQNGQLEQAITIQEQSLEVCGRYYQQNPDQWATNYAISLNSLAISYKKNDQLEQAIAIQEESLEICGRYYQQNPAQGAKFYAGISNYLVTSYQQNNQLEQAIALGEQSLEVSARYYQKQPSLFVDYLDSLNAVASINLQLRHYADASSYFNEYFNNYSYQNIERPKDVFNFIYPMVKFIQAIRRSDSDSPCDFKLMISDFSSFMRTKYRAMYHEVLLEEQANYSTLAESSDPLERERYRIFTEFFATDD